MQYALHCKLTEKDNLLSPKPFQIFLSGGGCIGKSFLIKAITEYLKWVLRYPNQNLDQPSVPVTACTGQSATGISGITLQSAFNLPIKSGLKSYEYKKPSDETLHVLRNKYQYLRALIIDEISMIGRENSGHLHLVLEAIMQNSSLNRVREGRQTDNDVIQIKALSSTDTATRPDEFVTVCLNNCLAGQKKEDCIGKLDSEVVVIKTQDGNKDIETNTCSRSIPDNIDLSQTVNLHAILKLCVGARVMLTDNISVSGRLINSSIGTVKHLGRRSKPLFSTIYVKLDDPKAGNSMKD